jgi:hypothetical protein
MPSMISEGVCANRAEVSRKEKRIQKKIFIGWIRFFIWVNN